MDEREEGRAEGEPRRIVVTDGMRNRYIAILVAIAIGLIALVLYV